jgi:RNA:NAD 2'-phosphotransferase (TPT1/KptA family)
VDVEMKQKNVADEIKKSGYAFYLSVNGVWLTKSVPLQYLKRFSVEKA